MANTFKISPSDRDKMGRKAASSAKREMSQISTFVKGGTTIIRCKDCDKDITREAKYSDKGGGALCGFCNEKK